MPSLIRRFIEKALIDSKACVIKADGISMLPIIEPGSTIEIVSVNENDLFPGQIILFEKGDQVLSHRVVYKVPIGYITAGDTNVLLDDPISPSQIIGLVQAVISPKGKRTELNKQYQNKRNGFSSEDKKLTFYFPDPYFKLIKNYYPTLQIEPLVNYSNKLIESSFAVSHTGLLTENQFRQQITDNDSLNLICFTDLGPENSTEYFSVNSVRCVFRPNIFNYLLNLEKLDIKDYSLSVISYLCGFFESTNCFHF
jgi:hypothetical protein